MSSSLELFHYLENDLFGLSSFKWKAMGTVPNKLYQTNGSELADISTKEIKEQSLRASGKKKRIWYPIFICSLRNAEQYSRIPMHWRRSVSTHSELHLLVHGNKSKIQYNINYYIKHLTKADTNRAADNPKWFSMTALWAST